MAVHVIPWRMRNAHAPFVERSQNLSINPKGCRDATQPRIVDAARRGAVVEYRVCCVHVCANGYWGGKQSVYVGVL